jgi:hypothetical protein
VKPICLTKHAQENNRISHLELIPLCNETFRSLFAVGGYVPSAATIKQGPKLAEYGVKDPDAEWGNYLLLRPWDEQKFLASLRAAENYLKPRAGKFKSRELQRTVAWTSLQRNQTRCWARLELCGKPRSMALQTR